MNYDLWIYWRASDKRVRDSSFIYSCVKVTASVNTFKASILAKVSFPDSILLQ